MSPIAGMTVRSHIAAALLAASSWTTGAEAATVDLLPSQDNSIFQGSAFEDNSCGDGSHLFAGATASGLFRRALLRFDVAGSLPAGATIDSVTLTLEVDRTIDGQSAAMTLHAVSERWGEGAANCDTVLGGGQGVAAGPGDATWLDARFQQRSWLAPGGDFGAARGAAMVGSLGPAVWSGTDSGNAGMVADVQRWLDRPAQNRGWILIGDEGRTASTRRFSSREGAAAPVLTVDYTSAGASSACCFDDGACTVTDAASCASQGGIPDAADSCVPNPCPQPAGACCSRDESCSDGVARDVCEAGGGAFQGSGSACSDAAVSCGLTPFVDPLPLPAVLQPVGTRADGTPLYEVTMTEERQQLHRDLPPTDVWTYNGTYPGPTIEAIAGQPIAVRHVNRLPAGDGHYLEVDECAHGPSYWQDTARAVVHLHGGHVPARFDGQPEYHILPGENDTYEYPNNQLPATLWYHDHALGITRLNVYMGMAAFYLLRDDFEEDLGLPSGEYEIALAVQDRDFNADGSFYYPATIQDSFFGARVLVNGKVWPYLDVARGKYRLRILNGSQARVYKLRLENLADPAQAIPFELIGTDGGLITAPISLDDFTMAPAERFDVVVDFSGFPAGTEIVLRNDDPAPPAVPNVMKFVVQDEAGHTAALPPTLRPVDPIAESEASATRRFELVRVFEPCAGRRWLINSLDEGGNVIGSEWDEITEYPILGSTEIWEFDNVSASPHPMHMHLVMFQVLERLDKATGQPLPLEPWEQTTWKDTVQVTPGTVVRVVARFEDYPGRFAYHCHILDHEDHEMMRQFQTTNDPASCNDNGVCEPGEDCVSCADCGSVSGAACGNGLCEVGDGEDCDTCPADCAGGGAFCCGAGASCGDPRCTSGFFCRAAPRVPACCGDQLCEGQETAASCAVDCAATCAEDSVTLCLNRGRFRVEVEWRDSRGGAGNGRVVPVSSADSGLFWFFSPENWEILVKVLDGCDINNRFWVFFAATTNVEFTVTVTDSFTGVTREYSNPLGRAADAVTDTAAFATCP